MKKAIISLSLAICVGGMSHARTLTPAEALERMASDSGMRRAAAIAPVTSFTFVRSVETPGNPAAVYLFSDSEASSLLVLSADDLAEPVLGYVTDTTGGEIPPAMEAMLRQYAEEIDLMRDSSAPAVLGQTKAPENRSAIAPMLTTNWGQGWPYNAKCPVVDEQATLTGCGATAMAQVMKYHRWPERGTGTGQASVMGADELSTMSLDSELLWDEMKNTYSFEATAEEADAVSTLMVTCGFASGMYYSPNWSETNMVAISKALKHNFNYDSGMELILRDQYTAADWEDKIYKSVAADGPVIYRGNGPYQGGHIFVCDGYDGEGMFHINWGWYGSYNGYFRLSALNPYGQQYYYNKNFEDGGFSQGQFALIGISKPKGETVTSKPILTLTSPMRAYYQDGLLSVFGTWSNYTPDWQSFTVSMVIESIDAEKPGHTVLVDNIKDMPVSYHIDNFYLRIDDLLPEYLSKGSYRGKIVTTTDGIEYYDAAHPMAWSPYFYIEVGDNCIESVRTGGVSLPVVEKLDGATLPFIYRNTPIFLDAVLSNPYDYEITSYIIPYMPLENGDMILGDGALVTIPAKASVEKTFTVRCFSDVEVGTGYQIGLCDYDLFAVLQGESCKDLEVCERPENSILTVENLAVEILPQGLQQFSGRVRCDEGYFCDYLLLRVGPAENPDEYFIFGTLPEPTIVAKGTSSDFGCLWTYPEENEGLLTIATVYQPMGDSNRELGSLTFRMGQSGVEDVAAARGSVVGAVGGVRALGLEGADVDVFTVDGRLVASEICRSADHAIEVPAGLYVVRAAGIVRKITVR